MDSTKRTTIRMTDERQRLFKQSKDIVAAHGNDDPPSSDVIDAALSHLIESRDNLKAARTDLDPTAIQQFNIFVLRIHYRISIDSNWR
jgi:hypothetical protein